MSAEISHNFIEQIVAEDIINNKNDGKVVTRFPPEPNGYLHIGHAKSVFLNFGIAKKFNGECHLRFDDTNPEKEEQEYIDAIQEDLRWLGVNWGDHIYYTSDYFEKLYKFAVKLIRKGLAYVDDLSAEEIRAYRGTLTTPGKNSPHRDRSVEENIELFERMRAGDFKDGEKTLRAKIDMSHPNINMRDPVMYRIKHTVHPRTGDKWCIYPSYDFAHGQSDSIEGITHSICTLEFEDHRPLYNWFVENLEIFPSKQYEFARLNMTYTLMSKRKLLKLVKENYVKGWDDPRMPTISGIRRRGFTPQSIRRFTEMIGVSKANSTVDFAMLEYTLREDLNKKAKRAMAVLEPLKLIIDNYPENKSEWLEADNNPEDPAAGKRKLAFSRELYIEKNDFMENPPKKYFRLSPGKEVRLKHAYYVTCTDVVKDPEGNVIEVHCEYDQKSRGGWTDDGRKVRGTLHWVSAGHAVKAEVRLYEQLFVKEDPNDTDNGRDFTANLNPDSLKVIEAYVEPELANAAAEERFQFLRQGYFVADRRDHTKDRPVFNRVVGLRDSWARKMKKN